MTTQEIIDKLIRAGDLLQEGILTTSPMNETDIAYYGVEFEYSTMEDVSAAIEWFKRNMPVGVKLHELSGYCVFAMKRKGLIIPNTAMVYLIQDKK